MESRHPKIGKEIVDAGTLPDELAEKLKGAIKDFRSTFQTAEGAPPLKEAEATPLEEEAAEALKKFRRPSPEEFQKKAGPAGKTPGAQLPG
jgi:hypothetical protein